MSLGYVRITFIMLILVTYPYHSSASMGTKSQHLKLRTGEHSSFLRIVLEGDEVLISKAKVTGRGDNIVVGFDAPFTIKKKQSKTIAYMVDKGSISFTPGRFSKFKFFFLKRPSRLVIDVYRDTRDTKNRVAPPVKESREDKKAGKPVREERTASRDDAEVEFYKQKIKEILRADNPFKALKEYSEDETDHRRFLAIYHFVLAEMFSRVEDYLSAIAHYGLVPVYTDLDELKELALGKRAELYLRLGRAYEAKANYLNFIRNFPSSRYIAKAHLGLAKSLEGIGQFREAIRHYKKAGETPEALFGIAKALQKLGMTKEAQKAYERAMRVDNTYPAKDPETYFLMGENMRMSGRLKEARKHLMAAKKGHFKYRASLSIGLIDLEELKFEEAIENFRTAAMSEKRNVKGEALFYLSRAFLKKGRTEEAITTLENIRDSYPYTPKYRDAMLELSRLYRKEGRLQDSIAMLKSLIYGQSPPAEVFTELETTLLNRARGDEKDVEELVILWNEVGQWLLDSSREQLLLDIAKALRYKGRPFLRLSGWLVEHGSEKVRSQAALGLADFYADMADAKTARRYLKMVRDREGSDAVLRIEAKIHHATGDNGLAVERLYRVKRFDHRDLSLLRDIIFALEPSEETGKLRKRAVALYERMVKALNMNEEEFTRLADILYASNMEREALRYYKRAKKDEWVMYRIGVMDTGDEGQEMLRHLQRGDSLLSRVARARLMAEGISKKVAEVF